MNKVIDGREISLIHQTELMKKISLLNDKLTLVDINVGSDEATSVYVKQKEKMAIKIGYNFINLHFDHIEENDLIKEIQKLNNDSKITGIIVQLPLPDYINKERVINSIDVFKDVDGLTRENVIKLIKNEPGLRPCTPKGVMSLFEYLNIDLEGKKVTLVGRSHLVGLPLFHMLLNKNATVTLCHSKTKDLSLYTKDSDIVITAVGKKGLITPDMIDNNTILIDIGITRFEGKLYGDIDASCMDKALFMTPVPGGVGPMTVISLMENLYLAYKLQNK